MTCDRHINVKPVNVTPSFDKENDKENRSYSQYYKKNNVEEIKGINYFYYCFS